MTKPILTGKLALVAVFCFFLSSFALFWLSLFSRTHDLLARIGFLCALLCVLGSLVLSWSVCFAYVARKRDWSSETCMRAGVPLLVAGVLLFILGGDRLLSQVGTLLACNALLAGFITRRFAYPELTDEEPISQKPLTLFPR